MCSFSFFPKKYRGVERDWSLSQTYEIPPACVNTNLLVASFTQSYIDIAASTCENTASIEPRVFALFSSIETAHSFGERGTKGAGAAVATTLLPYELTSTRGNSKILLGEESESSDGYIEILKIGR